MYNQGAIDSATNASDSKFRQCRPVTASLFEVENEVTLPGVLVQIQNYRWDEPMSDGIFEPEVCYLDLSLRSRSSVVRSALRKGAHYSGHMPIGDCVFWPAGSEVHSRIPAFSHRTLCCMFEPALLEQHLELSWSPFEMAACFDVKNLHIRNGLTRLAQEIRAPGFASDILVQSIVGQLVIEVARHFRGAKNSAGEAGSRLTPSQLRLLNDLMEGMEERTPSLEEFAKVCGLSVRHLIRAFKNTTGKTLGESIANVRIDQAKMLLSNPEIPIKNVAFTTGFQSAAGFSTAFRKATGWSPRQFRKEICGFLQE